MLYGFIFLIFPIHATRSANFNVLDFITHVLFYEEYTLWKHAKQLTIGKDMIFGTKSVIENGA